LELPLEPLTAAPALAPAAARPPAAPAGRPAALAVILLAGAVVRLLLWAEFRHEPIHIWDEWDYNALATNLVQHGEFTFNPGGTPTSLRPPLYPAVVAAVYRLSGGENFAAVRLLQAALSLLTVAVVYRLGREVASPRTATWLAGLCCFYPTLLAFNNLLLTEVLFTLLLTTSCYLLVLALRRASVTSAALAGVVLGLAALTRSVVWLAPPFLAVFLLLTWKGGWAKRLAAAAAVTAAFAATVAPWAVRNTRLQQTFVAIDVMGGRNFMMGNYRYTPLYRPWDAIALEGEQSWEHEVFTTYPPEQRPTQGAVDKLALRQGLAFVREHPGLTLERSVVKFFDFWGLEREIVAGAGRGLFGQVSKAVLLGLTACIAGGYALALFLAVFGAFCAPPADRRAHWLFLCVIAFVCGIHTVVFGHSRYHLPVMPLVLVYTAGALAHAGAVWRQRATRRFALAATLCGVLVAGWAWSLIAVDWERFVAAWRAAV
jgi:4-amino-4-deoxy-L-arabinose transferase-like glycosyltransferase